MERLLLIPIFVLELKKYLIGNKLVFQRANSVKWLEYYGVILMVLYTIFTICIPQSKIINMLVVYGIILLITWFSIGRQDMHGKVVELICLTVIEYCINKSCYPITNLFEQQFQDLSGVIYWRLLLESLWGMFIVLIFGGYAKRKRKTRKDILSPSAVSGLLVLIVVRMLGSVIGMRFVGKHIVHAGLQRMTEILVTVACISVCLLIWMLLYFRSQRESAEEELALSEELRETELSYYQAMLEKEEETRKFCHDIKNHLFCVNELVNQGKLEELKEYLQNFSEEFGEIAKKSYTTQNPMFDAILHDKLNQLDDTVEIIVQGYFTGAERMDLYDFCLVFSNLLNNATEELLWVKETGRKGFLHIRIKCTENFSEVKISNAVKEKLHFNKYGLPETKKADKKYHGFGLKKVQSILEKYQGEIKFTSTPEAFEVTVKY